MEQVKLGDKEYPRLNYRDQAVMMGEQLADVLGTTESTIRSNFNNHKRRFEEGRDFFKIKGAELKAYRLCVHEMDAQIISKKD